MIADAASFRLMGAAHARFAGFYSVAAREHDFYAGRYFAQRALRDGLGVDIDGEITEEAFAAFKEGFHDRHGPMEDLRGYFETVDERVDARDRIEKRSGAYIRYLDLPWWLRMPVMSGVHSWLDEELIYMPQWVDLTALGEWREIESLAAGLQVDIAGPVFQIKPGWYDGWIRGTGFILQPYVAGEIGYKHARYHYVDATIAPQLGWYRWLPTPVRIQLEFGRRWTFDEFDNSAEGRRWVAGIGFKWAFLYLSGKNFLQGEHLGGIRFSDDWDWRFGLVFNPIRLAETIGLVF
jgi:hypothetical protein